MKKKKGLFVTIRKWLLKNKILFETIGVCSLTIIAIMISYLSYDISKHEDNLTEYQVQLNKLEHQPIFKIDYNGPFLFDELIQRDSNFSFVYLDSPSVIRNGSISITNVGSPVTELNTQVKTYFRMVFFTNFKNNSYSDIFVPIDNYYSNNSTWGPQVTGDNVKIFPNNALLYYSKRIYPYVDTIWKIKRDLRNYTYGSEYYYPFIEGPFFILTLKYTDVFQDTYHHYYVLNSKTSIEQLDKENGDKITSYLNNYFNDFYLDAGSWKSVNVSYLDDKLHEFSLNHTIKPHLDETKLYNSTNDDWFPVEIW